MEPKKRRRVSFDGIDMSVGKIPPSAIDLEEAVLGGLLIESANHLDDVMAILSGRCFYKEAHNLIYKAIIDLYNAKEPVDILTVTAQLKKSEELELVGGGYYITQLTNRVASNANIIFHARLVAEAYLAREIIRIGGEFQNRAFEDSQDVFELIEELHKEVDNLKNYGVDGNEVPLSVQIDERIAEKDKLVKDGVKFTGITTGNDKLDSITGGWVKQNLIIVAGRPGSGKSVKGLDYAKHCAKSGKYAVVFSLEMSTQELIDRFIVAECQIPLHHYRANNLTHYQMEQIKYGAKELKKLPMIIYDKGAIDCSFIRRKAKSAIKRHGSIGMIVVDYLQLMTAEGKNGNREQEVSSISRGLKALAKELDVPVIALAQVGRGSEQSKDKRPDLSHLRESGQIEGDADVVMFIYRAAYHFSYGKHPDDEYSQDNISESEYDLVAELLVAKNRNGVPSAKIKEKFMGAFSTFYQYGTDNMTPFVEPEEENEPQDAPF